MKRGDAMAISKISKIKEFLLKDRGVLFKDKEDVDKKMVLPLSLSISALAIYGLSSSIGGLDVGMNSTLLVLGLLKSSSIFSLIIENKIDEYMSINSKLNKEESELNLS